ncbi:MAG: ABC transporter ATP-binding protein [Methanobacteriota archaeon]|nr:MAG: ABC transporter ATP-binding protein [Euryarchaeota archaeon]
MIEIENLVKKFGRKRVIDGVNLTIDKGNFLAILGPNGAGKTTLLNLICTLLRPSSGSILVDKLDTKEDGIEVRRKIGVLAHVSYLYDDLSALENLKFYGKMYGIKLKEERIKRLLSRVKLLHRMNDMVGTYSRGMKQRLSIARAVVHDPDVLLLDEPYTGLDLNGCEILNEMLLELGKQKKTIVMVTHDVERGHEMGERLAVMIDGKMAADFRKEDMGLDEFKRRYRKLLGAA